MEGMGVGINCFPVGLRVLAVDNDPACLMLLDGLLQECQYHVTTTNQMTTALKMLRENGNRFDLIICEVHMPDIDGFKLLELLGLEMDLPVIMMSANSDPSLVMKGITHGACDYFVKPVRLQELRNIWQHVIRKKKVESDHNENASEDPNTQKKPRVIWSLELHKKFVAAVNQLGIDKAVPKRILDLMNVEGLTRENVASHLQKYRLYLRRISLQQANRVATFGGTDAYVRMSSIDVIGDFRTLPGSGRLPDTALSSYPPSGIQGRLNSTSGVSFQDLAPSTLIQPNRTQNLSYSLNNIGQSQPVVSSASQNSNLYPRIPSSFEFDQLQPSKSITQIGDFNSSDDPRIFTASSTFKDARAAAGVFSNSLPTSNPMILQGTPKTLGDFLITSSMKYLFLLLLLLLFLYFFFGGKEFGTPGELGFRGGRGIKFIPFQMQLLDHAE